MTGTALTPVRDRSTVHKQASRLSCCFPRQALALSLLLPLTLSGCKTRQGSADAAAQPVSAAVGVVQRGNISHVLSLAGQFQPYQVIDVHAKVSGYVRHIYVDIGDRVHAGQTLAVLEVPELSAQYRGSQSEQQRSKEQINIAQHKYAPLHSSYWGAGYRPWTALYRDLRLLKFRLNPDYYKEPTVTPWEGMLAEDHDMGDLEKYFQRCVAATRMDELGKNRIAFSPLAINEIMGHAMLPLLARVLGKDAARFAKGDGQ